jgi:hypothetical protein
MSITAAITKPLEQGYVQVDTAYKNGYKRYYKVPQRNARAFAADRVEQEKKLNLYSNIVFFSSIFTGVIVSSFFTKKIDSRFKQFLINTASAIGLASLTSYGMNKYAMDKVAKLAQSHCAKEIFYRA